jgi:hypothetical protein
MLRPPGLHAMRHRLLCHTLRPQQSLHPSVPRSPPPPLDGLADADQQPTARISSCHFRYGTTTA